MTMSFDDWKEGKVAPATVDIPVVESEAQKSSSGESGYLLDNRLWISVAILLVGAALGLRLRHRNLRIVAGQRLD